MPEKIDVWPLMNLLLSVMPEVRRKVRQANLPGVMHDGYNFPVSIFAPDTWDDWITRCGFKPARGGESDRDRGDWVVMTNRTRVPDPAGHLKSAGGYLILQISPEAESEWFNDLMDLAGDYEIRACWKAMLGFELMRTQVAAEDREALKDWVLGKVWLLELRPKVVEVVKKRSWWMFWKRR